MKGISSRFFPSPSPAPDCPDHPGNELWIDNLHSPPSYLPDLTSCNDPAPHLVLLPDHVLDSDIGTLGLPAGLQAALTRCGIRTLRQLRHYSYAQLVDLKFMRRQDPREIVKHLRLLSAIYAHELPDIASVIGHLPDGLLSGSISFTHMDATTSQALIANDIYTYEDLCRLSADNFLQLPAITPAVVKSLIKHIRELPEVYAHEASVKNQAPAHSLIEWHRQCLSQTRDAARLESLLLMHWGNGLTIDQSARALGITRGTASHLIANHCKLMRSSCGAILIRKLEALMQNRKTPLLVRSLAAEDRWFACPPQYLPHIASPALFAARLVSAMLGDHHVVNFRGQHVLTRASQSQISRLPAACLSRLKTDQSLRSPQQARQAVVEECTKHNAGELAVTLFRLLISSAAHSHDRALPIVRRSPAAVYVKAVLLESDRPLHIDEIADRLINCFNKQYSEGTLRNTLSRMAKHFGRNVWGLEGHLSAGRDDRF